MIHNEGSKLIYIHPFFVTVLWQRKRIVATSFTTPRIFWFCVIIGTSSFQTINIQWTSRNDSAVDFNLLIAHLPTCAAGSPHKPWAVLSLFPNSHLSAWWVPMITSFLCDSLYMTPAWKVNKYFDVLTFPCGPCGDQHSILLFCLLLYNTISCFFRKHLSSKRQTFFREGGAK